MKKIYFTVTNDLSYDQRMIRICSALANSGYAVTLVGRKRAHSVPLIKRAFEQKRLNCWFDKGKFFYMEYNIRLVLFLLFNTFDAVCSIDLDTIMAGFYASKWKGKPCIYDAHEYFTEVPEVVERPKIKRIWEWVAQKTIPRIAYNYTVCQSIKEIFEAKYGQPFEVIRNVPFKTPVPTPKIQEGSTVLLYQGALNDGRGLEEIIEALNGLENVVFWLAGEGDLSQQLRTLVRKKNLESRVTFLGFVQPEELKEITLKADIGVNLLKNKGLNYYYSLANKFFDYIQANKPSLNMAFPEYQNIVSVHEVGVLLPDLAPETIQKAVKSLQEEKEYKRIQQNCLLARDIFTWEQEELKLIAFYETVFNK